MLAPVTTFVAADLGHSFAALSIAVLFWWTVISPLGCFVVALACGSRIRLRVVLTVAVIAPPLLVLAPVAMAHGLPVRLPAAATLACALAAVAFAVLTFAGARRSPARSARLALVTSTLAVVAGMLGSLTLLGASVLI